MAKGKIMSYITSWEENGVYWVFSETLTNDDLLISTKKLYADPRYPNINYTINDFNAVTEFPIDSSVVRQVAEIDAKHSKINPNIKVAIVANSQVIKGLTKMYQTYFELSIEQDTPFVKIFETVDDARKWINN